MEDTFLDPVQFSKGINLNELMTKETEFHIDIDFKKKGNPINIDDDLFPDGEEDESDTEDVLKNIENSVSKMMLASPEYHSFKELAEKMTDCLPSGDVKMLILEEGDGPLISLDAEVTVHYAAYWEKASIPFDSTLTMNGGAPLRIRLGIGRVLPGLEIGLTSIRGPIARVNLLLQPNTTWGLRGAPPRIRGEPALFVVQVYGVSDVGAPSRFNDLPMEEQKKYEVTIKTVNSLHVQAKDLFAKQKYQRAIKNYQQSISVLNVSKPKTDAEEDEIKKLKISAYVNLAVCYYKIKKPKYVLNMCDNLDRIMDINKHCKALFYYGRAYEMLGKVEDAVIYYKKALKLEPKNNEIGKTLAALDEREKISAEREKEMWQTAFMSVPEKEKDNFDVDIDFQNSVMDMCQDLAGREEYAKIDLPTGLTKDEIICFKSLASKFKCLIVDEDGEGERKKISIIKKHL